MNVGVGTISFNVYFKVNCVCAVYTFTAGCVNVYLEMQNQAMQKKCVLSSLYNVMTFYLIQA
jgi:hypothetical protein